MARHIDTLLTEGWTAHAETSSSFSGKRVLIATSMGGFNQGAVTEKAIAIALMLRGAHVDVFLCDGAPACQLTKIGSEPPDRIVETDERVRCPKCIAQGRAHFAPLGVDIFTLRNNLSAGDIDEAERLAEGCDIDAVDRIWLGDWAIGVHAMAGALRYFARGDFSGESLAEEVARKFVKASVLTARAIERVLSLGDYDVVVCNHGIYTPQGVIGEVARSRNIRVVNWNPAYRRHCFIFSHGESYHHTMISEDVSAWESLVMTSLRRQRILKYLQDRREAKGDWIWFNNAPDMPFERIAKDLALDDRPVVAALTSVVWDACLHYDSNAFNSLKDWMLQTIAYFETRPDLQLVVRIHPAEVSGFVKSRDPMADAIAARFPVLPENVSVVPPEDECSTYSLIDHADAVLVYSTKTGIEASAAGARVIVAGEAWVRNKGFTRDASSPESYRAILDELPFKTGLEPSLRRRALKYAYHFFFRRMIELPFLKLVGPAQFEIDIEDLCEFGPGRHAGLDCVCKGILDGAPFIYDPEEADGADASAAYAAAE